MVEADAHEQSRIFHARKLAGLHLDRVRIAQRGRQAFDFDFLAADRLDQALQVGRGRDDGKRRGPGGRAPQNQQRQRAQHRYFFFTNIDFGTMQWTPLRTSTTWLTRQSAAMDVNA